MPNMIERGRGLLVGQALGDALGALVEGMSAHEIAAYMGRVDRIPVPGDRDLLRHQGRLPGLYTDDTQLALAIADTLIQTETFSPDYFINLCVRLADADRRLPFGAFRGSGANFRHTVARFREGVPWNRSGSNTAGNGAAMRVAPVGLFFAHDPARLIRAAAESAICTHRNPTGVLAAITVAQATAAFCADDPGTIQPKRLAAHLQAQGRQAAEILRGEYAPYLTVSPAADDPWLAGLSLLDGLLDLDDAELAARVRAHAAPHAAFPLHEAADPYAPASVLLALAMTLKYAPEPVECLPRLIGLGGDTDTTGAMAGAMLGALHGVAVWPLSWVSALADATRLAETGARLARVSQGRPVEAVDDWVEAEAVLSRREYAWAVGAGRE